MRSLFGTKDATAVPDDTAAETSAPAPTAPVDIKRPSGPYRTDAPISDPRLDVFDREPFAHRIADTIGERNDLSSIVVGIYGPWGDGKTTVLNFIRNRLRCRRSRDGGQLHHRTREQRWQGRQGRHHRFGNRDAA